ncbi:hypothetical protein [Chitinimonas sp. JJ19]|uniref:hypothetical protein n=1 Tax=Chitinimonas sp. JJ19 TaxID=3109352 RepID=UPI0030034B81
MFFRKQKHFFNITKLYFTADLTAHIDPEWLVGNLFERCIGRPVEYSINCGGDKKISSLPSALKRVSLADFEAFDCSDESGRVVLSIGRAGKAFDEPDSNFLFECFVISKPSSSFEVEIDIFAIFSSAFELHYGYAGRLPDDFSPASETRIKMGLFGSGVKVGSVEDSWLHHPKGVISGSIKGVYPVNYWKNPVASRLADMGFKLSEEGLGQGGIVCFDLNQLKRIAKDNPAYDRFIHDDWCLPA